MSKRLVSPDTRKSSSLRNNDAVVGAVAFVLLGVSGAATIGGCMDRPVAVVEMGQREGPSNVSRRVVNVNGWTLHVTSLSTTLARLRALTTQATAQGIAQNGNNVVTLGEWSTNYFAFAGLSVNVAIHNSDGTVYFGPRSSHDALRVELHAFSGLISSVSGGRVLTSFEMLGESVTAANGENMARIYAVPRDQSDRWTAQWSGGQIALAANIYPDSSELRRPYDSPYVSLLLDPGVPEPAGTHDE